MRCIRWPPGSADALVYFSSVSENTHRFVEKLGLPPSGSRLHGTLRVDEPYVLICRPTAAAAADGPDRDAGGFVPKQVIAFLTTRTTFADPRSHRGGKHELR